MAETFHKTVDTLPKCDTCGAPATHGTFDNFEVVSSSEWREFEPASREKRGCAQHPVVSRTIYKDGRTRLTAECVPEKVPCPVEQTL